MSAKHLNARVGDVYKAGIYSTTDAGQRGCHHKGRNYVHVYTLGYENVKTVLVSCSQHLYVGCVYESTSHAPVYILITR